jgi:hypothetical protein
MLRWSSAPAPRTHREAERAYLRAGRADEAILDEHLLAQEIVDLIIERLRPAPEAGGDSRPSSDARRQPSARPGPGHAATGRAVMEVT